MGESFAMEDDRKKTVNADQSRNDARCPICGTRFEGSKGIPWGPLDGPHRFEGSSFLGHVFVFDTQVCADEAWGHRKDGLRKPRPSEGEKPKDSMRHDSTGGFGEGRGSR